MRYCIKRLGFSIIGFSLFILFVFVNQASAQYTIIGQNSFGGTNFYGPMTTSASADTFFSRHAYIYPSTTLGGLQHGDTIRSLEFFKSDFNTFAGNPEFRIYMSMSANADLGTKNIHWPNEAAKSGTVKVYDGDPGDVADSTTGFKRFDLNTALFVFDTTLGSNLKILVEFIQYQIQTAAVTWVYENDFTVPAFISNNEGKYVNGASLPTDSTVGSNLRKPYIKINYPRYDKNLEVGMVYCLGRAPVLMNRADSVMAIVSNSGLKTVYNHPVYIKVSGANIFLDSIFIDSLQPSQSMLVVFGSHKPDTQGTENIIVEVGQDDFSADNADSVSRIVGYNVYSHADPFTGNAGGIGFNGSTGDFVAKFYTDSIIYINQIKVDFSGSGRDFQLGIWNENSNGLPGTNIFTSDSLVSVSGTYILSVLPRVKIDGGFFVGIRQTGTTNVAFAYQPESPVRPNAFYFAAPLGDTSWVPFAPGFDFKFNIQPRIQVGNDVAVLSIDYPTFGDTIEYNQFDSLAPQATIVNYGFIDQKAPFDIFCEIVNQFGKIEYSDTISITINSNDTVQVTFAKRMSLNNFGKMQIRVFTRLHSDKVADNDTLTGEFNIVVRHDVAVENYFDPVEDQKFQMNSDRVGPVVRVANFGANTKSNIQVTSQIRQGNKVAHVQTKSTNLAGSGSVILSYDSFTIPWWGDVIFEAYCWNVVDSFPSNDTARVNVYVDKSHDIGIKAINRPKMDSRHERNTSFQPYIDIRNYGVLDQDTIPVTAEVFDASGKLIYTDNVVKSLIKFSTTQVLFKTFTAPDTVQRLQFRVITRLALDQDQSNDTGIVFFDVVTARDIAITQIIEPEDKRVYNASTSFTPEIEILNLGNAILTSPPVFYFKIEDGTDKLWYLDSATISTSLDIDAIDTLTFSKSFDAVLKNNYTCTAWHKWASDGERSNDNIISTFEVSFLKSIEATSLVLPEDGRVYQFNQASILPKFTFKNDGLETVTTPINYHLLITSSSSTFYDQSGIVDSMNSGELKTIEFTVPIVLMKQGITMCFYTSAIQKTAIPQMIRFAQHSE